MSKDLKEVREGDTHKPEGGGLRAEPEAGACSSRDLPGALGD